MYTSFSPFSHHLGISLSAVISFHSSLSDGHNPERQMASAWEDMPHADISGRWTPGYIMIHPLSGLWTCGDDSHLLWGSMEFQLHLTISYSPFIPFYSQHSLIKAGFNSVDFGISSLCTPYQWLINDRRAIILWGLSYESLHKMFQCTYPYISCITFLTEKYDEVLAKAIYSLGWSHAWLWFKYTNISHMYWSKSIFQIPDLSQKLKSVQLLIVTLLGNHPSVMIQMLGLYCVYYIYYWALSLSPSKVSGY